MLCSRGPTSFWEPPKVTASPANLTLEGSDLIEGWSVGVTRCGYLDILHGPGLRIEMTHDSGFSTDNLFSLDSPNIRKDIREWMMAEQDRMLQEAASCLTS